MSAAWLPVFVASLGPPERPYTGRYVKPENRRIQIIYEARLKSRRLQMLMEYDHQKDAPLYLEKGGYLMLPIRKRDPDERGGWHMWEEVNSDPPQGRFGVNPIYQVKQHFADRLKQQQEIT